MTKKTKNIIVISIIGVLLICLAFTIKEMRQDNDFIPRINQTNINRRDMRRHNYRFNPEIDDRTENKDENDASNKEETTKEDSSCGCNMRSRLYDNRDNMFYGEEIFDISPTVSTNDSLSVWLIGIETFLLGGSVMFLILNNIDDDKSKRK